MCANFANPNFDQFVTDFAKNDAEARAYRYQPGDKGFVNINQTGLARIANLREASKAQPIQRQEASSSKGGDTRADLLGGESKRREFAGGSNEGNLGRKTLLGG